jgi:hypothetical protein
MENSYYFLGKKFPAVRGETAWGAGGPTHRSPMGDGGPSGCLGPKYGIIYLFFNLWLFTIPELEWPYFLWEKSCALQTSQTWNFNIMHHGPWRSSFATAHHAWNPKVHYRIHNTLDPFLGQFNPIHTIASSLRYIPAEWLFPSRCSWRAFLIPGLAPKYV